MKHSSRTNLVPVAAALALALVAGPLLALDAPPGPPSGPQGPLAGTLRCLGIVRLTDAQKADVRALLEAAKPELEVLREDLKTDRAALRTALAATPPDPCAVGTAVLEVEADLKEIREATKELRAAIGALLTPEQKAKLEGCLRAPRRNGPADEDGETAEL
ncbi:MAG: Spy/CpxP family protein refolding chaperone [Thermoanaerobaculia bacterium]